MSSTSFLHQSIPESPMEPTIPFTAVRKKVQRVDYATAETSQNAYQTHLCDTSTQTTLAGHMDNDCLQIFNPPRGPPKQRKKDYAERQERRKRSNKKKPARSPEAQRRLEEARQVGELQKLSDQNLGSGKNAIETEEDNDGRYEYEGSELQVDVPHSNAMTGPTIRPQFPGAHSHAAEPIEQPPRRLAKLLDALDSVQMPFTDLKQTQGLIQYELGLLKEERDICEDLEDRLCQLQKVTHAIINEVDALQEGLVNDRLKQRDRLIQIGTLKSKLSLLR